MNILPYITKHPSKSDITEENVKFTNGLVLKRDDNYFVVFAVGDTPGNPSYKLFRWGVDGLNTLRWDHIQYPHDCYVPSTYKVIGQLKNGVLPTL